jgi:hypothetical protein
MAPAKSSSGKDTYSVILPTFNERQNLPIITWLLNRTFTEKFVDPIIPPMSYALSAIPDPIPSLSFLYPYPSVAINASLTNTHNPPSLQQHRLGARNRRRRLTRRHARRS